VENVVEPTALRERLRLPMWLGLCFFLAVATFFLWEEHKAHILGLLPYVLLLLCLIVHPFMHRGHGSHGAGHSERDERHQAHQGRGAS
jgi:hypothetical protein